MLTERQVQETIARCVSIAVYYHVSEPTNLASDRMVSEVRSTALSLEASGLSGSEARRRIVEPVGRELVARFGTSAGSRLVASFADAFEGDDPEAPRSQNVRWRNGAKVKVMAPVVVH